MVKPDELRQNIDAVRERIGEALRDAGRTDKVTVVGASKTMPREIIRIVDDNRLLEALGENRVQELLDKCDIKSNIKWHFIGTLQTNKIKQIIDKVELIHSVDRDRLAAELNDQARKRGITVNCLIQVNMGREENKSGYYPEELDHAIRRIKESHKSLNVKGVMAVMPIADEERLINIYEELGELYRNLKEKYALEILSAGMTNDYHLAVRYAGSNMVRIGRAIFGSRCNNEEVNCEIKE